MKLDLFFSNLWWFGAVSYLLIRLQPWQCVQCTETFCATTVGCFSLDLLDQGNQHHQSNEATPKKIIWLHGFMLDVCNWFSPHELFDANVDINCWITHSATLRISCFFCLRCGGMFRPPHASRSPLCFVCMLVQPGSQLGRLSRIFSSIE